MSAPNVNCGFQFIITHPYQSISCNKCATSMQNATDKDPGGSRGKSLWDPFLLSAPFSVNLKLLKKINILYFKLFFNRVDTQCYINFRCTT